MSAKRKTVSMTAFVYARLSYYADQEGVSMAGFVTGLIEDALDKLEVPRDVGQPRTRPVGRPRVGQVELTRRKHFTS